MKQKLQKRAAVLACAVLMCASLLCGTASAAALVVIDLAGIVDSAAPSVVEVFTETKQVSSWFQEYVTEGAGSGVVLSEMAISLPITMLLMGPIRTRFG